MTGKPLARGREAAEHLTRAARICGTAASVFAYDGTQEIDRVGGCGSCTSACRHVATLPWGPQACRRSREKAALAALRRRKTVPFVCHMGFSCVATSHDPSASANRAIILGPFCPTETPDALERDALDGLEKLGPKRPESLPFQLTDVPLTRPDVVVEVADWLRESLGEKIHEAATITAERDVDEPASGKSTRRRAPKAHRDAYQAGDILAALRAGNRARARSVVRAVIADTAAPKRTLTGARRFRAVALTAAVLEAAEAAGVDTQASREKFHALIDTLESAADSGTLVRACMSVFARLKMQTEADPARHASFVAMDTILDALPTANVTLASVAERLGENPTTLTKRLQRTYGMSFSEYLGRRRVDRAKELLRDSSLTVREVTRRVGLSDPSNLGKIFRKFEGMTPTQYRKRFTSKTRGTKSGRPS